jgi:hypothetical protein
LQLDCAECGLQTWITPTEGRSVSTLHMQPISFEKGLTHRMKFAYCHSTYFFLYWILVQG